MATKAVMEPQVAHSKHNSFSKPSTSAETRQEDISALYTILKAKLDADEFSKASSMCDELLQISPLELDAIRCKVYCLMQLEKWSPAYNVIQSCQRNGELWPKMEKMLAFERSYCLYRKNRLTEAMTTLNNYKNFVLSKKDKEDMNSQDFLYDDKFILLEAQLYSRLFAYEKARTIYNSLLKEDPGNILLKSNHMATNISSNEILEIPVSLRDVKEEAKESYEWMFNVACYLIECNRLNEALYYLDEAEGLCRKELQAENKAWTPSEIDSHKEIAYFKVQKGYILQKLGHVEAAKELYMDIAQADAMNNGPEIEVSVLAASTNNYHLLSPLDSPESLASILQTFQTNFADTLKKKLTRKQALHLAVNKCLSFLQEKRFEHCKTALNFAMAEFGKNEKILLFVNIALQIAQRKFKKAINLVENYHTIHPEEPLCILAKAYLFISSQKYDQAAALLISLPDETFLHPEFLRCVIETQELSSNPLSSVEITLQRVENLFEKHHKSMDSSHIGAFLMVLMTTCWRLQLWKKVSFYSLQYLQFVDGLDLHALTYLVFSASFHDLSLAEEYGERLRSYFPSTYTLIDPEDILQSDWQAMIIKTKMRIEPKSKDVEKKSVERKRKQHRYPAGFDPQKPGPPPDPERWLPKHKRSSYKKKQRKRKEIVRGTTQGMVPSAAETGAPRRGAPSTARVSVSHDGQKGKRGRRSGRR